MRIHTCFSNNEWPLLNREYFHVIDTTLCYTFAVTYACQSSTRIQSATEIYTQIVLHQTYTGQNTCNNWHNAHEQRNTQKSNRQHLSKEQKRLTQMQLYHSRVWYLRKESEHLVTQGKETTSSENTCRLGRSAGESQSFILTYSHTRPHYQSHWKAKIILETEH